MVNDEREIVAAARQIGLGELALEYRKLQMVTVVPHCFEDLSQPLLVGDVVTDQV